MMSAYWTDTVVVKRATLDALGRKTFTRIAVRGRMEFKHRMVRNFQGEQVVSSAQVAVPTMTLTHEDRVEYRQKDYAIVEIAEVRDFSVHHVRMALA